jgi:hypothetical protein
LRRFAVARAALHTRSGPTFQADRAARKPSSSAVSRWCRLSWSSKCLMRALTGWAIALTSGDLGHVTPVWGRGASNRRRRLR